MTKSDAKKKDCGRSVLHAVAPQQARLVDRFEASAWRAVAAQERLELFDLAVQAVALQHGLTPLAWPASFGHSSWSQEDVLQWRRSETIDSGQRAVLAFAEQIAFDVASVQPEQRDALSGTLGSDAVSMTQALYVADLLPRVRAALDACFGESDWYADLGLDSKADDRVQETDPGAEGPDGLDANIQALLKLVPGLLAIDPVTTELVRLLGARRHACRVCQSVRSYSAMKAGADDAMFDAVDRYAESDFTPAQKAALAFVDGLISSPARFEPAIVSELHEHFDAAGCVELVLDVFRNATNKIAVALGGDSPRVETGYEVYEVHSNGDIVYGLEAP